MGDSSIAASSAALKGSAVGVGDPVGVCTEPALLVFTAAPIAVIETIIATNQPVADRATPAMALPRPTFRVESEMTPSVIAEAAGNHARNDNPGIQAMTNATIPQIIAVFANPFFGFEGRGAALCSVSLMSPPSSYASERSGKRAHLFTPM
jgi:hypothetical protein